MTLTATFKKVQGNQYKVNHNETAGNGGGKGDPGDKGGPEKLDKHGKKRVIDQELIGSRVINDQQCNTFKLTVGEKWNDFGIIRSRCAPDGISRETASTPVNVLSATSHVLRSLSNTKGFSHLHGRMQGVRQS
jgi:hypothetical protein